MSFIDKHREPTPGELRLFGVLLATFLGLLGWLVVAYTGARTLAIILWSGALLLCAFYYAVPPARQMIFRAWMAVVYPIGWLISHALLAVIYYLLVTPVGLALRLCGRDSLQQEVDHSATTYWTPYRTTDRPSRYFQQF